MKYLAAILLMFGLNAWAQKSEVKPTACHNPDAQVRLAFQRAYNAKDIDAVVALYAENATLVSDGGTFRGRNEIRQWVKAGLDQGSRLDSIQPVLEDCSERLAYGTGQTRRRVGSVIHLGQYLIVMKKIGEEWRIVQHFSLSTGQIAAAN